jgi:hypothetical protein
LPASKRLNYDYSAPERTLSGSGQSFCNCLGPSASRLTQPCLLVRNTRKNIVMQNNIALALVIGALIIGAALVYHGQKLEQLSAHLEATQKQISTLDTNLQYFAQELPDIIGEAGENAGRQAVHGMAEEAFQMPLNWLKSTPLKGAAAGLRRVLSPADAGADTTNQIVPLAPTPIRSASDGPRRSRSTLGAGADTTNQNAPLIRFDIPQPTVINIGILTDLKDLPPWLRLLRGSQEQPANPTNQAAGQ